MVEEVFDFVVVEEGDLFADDMGELDKAGVEGVDAAFSEVFKKATEGNKMVSLGNGLEIFTVAVGFSVELETKFANKFKSNVGGGKIGEVSVVVHDDSEVGALVEDAEADFLETA